MNLIQPILVFDIETIPCLETAKQIYPELEGLSDKDAGERLFAITKEATGNEFLRLAFHKVACISFVWYQNDAFSLRTFSLKDMDEQTIIERFLNAFEQTPTLVGWNSSGFDLPLILNRALKYGLNASKILGSGDGRNAYTNRYSTKHFDLCTKMSFEAWGNKPSLNNMSALCGIAGKGDVDGSQVFPMVMAGEWDNLQEYCESDVLNTWLLYLKYLQLNGLLASYEYALYENQMIEFLSKMPNVPHARFLPQSTQETEEEK